MHFDYGNYIKVALLFVLAFAALFACGCMERVPDTPNIQETATTILTCNATYIKSGDECCLDLNNNSLCDDDEGSQIAPDFGGSTVPQGLAANGTVVNETAEETNATMRGKATESARTPEVSAERSKLSVSTDLGPVPGYLDIFEGKESVGVAFSSQQEGSIVAALTNIMNFLGYENVHDVSADSYTLEEVFSEPVIILGNGCTNEIVREFYSLDAENCDDGLEEGIVNLRLMRVNTNYALFVIGSDMDIYSAVKLMVAGKVAYFGAERPVDVRPDNT
jgi:hypothetical protein